MTIDQLIERLEEYRDMAGGDAEVRLMTQSNWPFENEVHGICSKDEIDHYDKLDEEEEDNEEEDESESVIYLVEGNQLGYGRKKAWEVCG